LEDLFDYHFENLVKTSGGVKEISSVNLVIGEEYKRSELHDAFGGNRQGGISTCANHDIIFIFSGNSGEQYGYSDTWEGDYYFYTGEGRYGDMEFKRGNAAIRDHESNGKRLLLMQSTRPTYVKYIADLACVDYNYFETRDFNGANRKAIRFTLERATDAGISAVSKARSSYPYKRPTKTERTGLVTSRVGQGWYRRALLSKFGGKCAVTGLDLEEVLIASHIVPWRASSEDERLDPNNGILLSPTYDALFDKHLISFSDDGNILVSSSLTAEQRIAAGINTNEKIKINEGMKAYLSRHRAELR